ncbi:MAG: response regulator [Chloroflexota bacterium]
MKGHYRILAVDDDDRILRSISSALRPHLVETASNNTQAYERFLTMPFDIAILDMNMPDFDGQPNPLSGIRLLQRLRQVDENLPAVFLTGEERSMVMTKLKAEGIEENTDCFFKVFDDGDSFKERVTSLLIDGEVFVRTTVDNEPRVIKRNNIINLQGVVQLGQSEGQGQVFMIERDDVSPDLLDVPWLCQSTHGALREEVVDIVGVRDNKFVVIGANNVAFLRDNYRNDILVRQQDLNGLSGNIVDVDTDMNRMGVQITSTTAPTYLTEKKVWQAHSEDESLFSIGTAVDVISVKDNRLQVRQSRTQIKDDSGNLAEVIKSAIQGSVAQVVNPIDESDPGAVSIISGDWGEDFKSKHWQALAAQENVFIPGERVTVTDVVDNLLLVEEYFSTD